MTVEPFLTTSTSYTGQSVLSTLVLNNVTPTVTGSQIGFGTTVTSGNSGSAGTYLSINIGGVVRKIALLLA
jgi:hypothetical protein